ncbi:MAG: ABC transporter permease [Aeoliella sp.]
MLLGPVFQSEMVTTARRTRYFVLRVLFAASLLLCLWGCYEGVTSWDNVEGRLSIRAAAQLAGSFFQSFAWLTLIAAIIVTPAIAAGAIASERERRTIEYLFATDLSNTEIVLSKLFGKLLLAAKLVLVALPVLAIFRLLGGIPGNLLIVYFAGLASTVALLTMGAMCISVWTARARDSIIRVYLVVAMIFLLPIMLFLPLMATGGAGGWWATQLSNVMSWCLEINPLWVLGQAVAGSGGLGVGLDASIIWRMVRIHLVLTVALAVVAIVAVRRVHLRSISSPGAAVKRRWFVQFPQFRPALRNRPMLWKELFARTAATKFGFLGRISLAIIMIGTVGIAIWVYILMFSNPGGWWGSPGEQYLQTSVSITCVLGVGSVILMGLRAAGLVTYEKERDCWLSLLSTPLTGAEILGAKVVGNLYAFRWMLLPLMIIWFLQLTLSPQYVIAIPMHLATIGATGLFATAVGLVYSLKFTSSLKAIGATVGTLFFTGGGWMLCCCVPLMFGGGDDDIMKFAMAACVPFLQVMPGPIMVVEDIWRHDGAWMVIDYFVGTAGYAIAGMVILSSIIGSFETMVGRTGSNEILGHPPRIAPTITPPE